MQNVLTLSARGPSVDVKTPDSNVCRRQIQTLYMVHALKELTQIIIALHP